jgi:hypothetical protein
MGNRELLGPKKEKAAEWLALLAIRGITQDKYYQGLAHKLRQIARRK